MRACAAEESSFTGHPPGYSVCSESTARAVRLTSIVVNCYGRSGVLIFLHAEAKRLRLCTAGLNTYVYA